MRRKIANLMVAVAMMFGLGVAVAGEASAAPYDCWARIATWRTHAFGGCNSGYGEFKVAMRCKNGLGWWAYRESAWTGAYWQSTHSTCPAGYFGVDTWVLVR